MKLKKWLCKKFGHKFNHILSLMFKIEHNSVNREQWKDQTIECERCGAIFKHRF